VSSREQKKSATRTQLVDAAARLFASAGVAATTMDDIAREAGTSRTSVFNYFGHKEMLLCEVGRRLFADLVTDVIQRPRRTAAATLRVVADGIASLSEAQPAVLVPLARELSHPQVAHRRMALQRTGIGPMVDAVIDQTVDSGRLRHPGYRATHARQLIDLLAGPVIRAGAEFPADRLRVELRRGAELFLEGATLPEPAPSGEMVAIPVEAGEPAEQPRVPTGA
jgi:AcrR family transcriptional regulator